MSYWLYQQHDYLGRWQRRWRAAYRMRWSPLIAARLFVPHLTGLTSDMGAAIGNWLAGRRIGKPTLGFQAIIWYCFCGGSGAFLYAKVGYGALFVLLALF